MVDVKPSPAPWPKGPRLLRRCPLCGRPIHLGVYRDGRWWLVWRHTSTCRDGVRRAVLAETENGRGDWLAFALALGLPVTYLDEIAVRLGVLPPTEKTLGRLLQPLEQRVIMRSLDNFGGPDVHDDKAPGLPPPEEPG